MADEAAPLQTGQTRTKTEDEWLAGWMHQIMYVTLRGAMSCAPMVRLEKMLMMACVTMARLVCEIYAGDELAVRRLRKNCLDLVEDTFRKMPVAKLEREAPRQAEASVAIHDVKEGA